MAADTLGGAEYVSLTGEPDWPPVNGAATEAWAHATDELRRTHEDLLAAVKAFPKERLGERLSNREFTYGFLIEGVIQHTAYHAGQIALLRKMSRAQRVE